MLIYYIYLEHITNKVKAKASEIPLGSTTIQQNLFLKTAPVPNEHLDHAGLSLPLGKQEEHGHSAAITPVDTIMLLSLQLPSCF